MGLPEVNKFYHFWDDGKCGVSRHYIARCEELIKLDDARNYLIADSDFNKESLLKLWVKEKRHKKWLFANNTDYIVRCSIPSYDANDIFFARDVDGCWFSFNTSGWWQGGRLDIDGKIYEHVLQDCIDWGNWDAYEAHQKVTY